MAIEIDEGNVKNGVLGLVVALVQIIRDALKCEALRRMEGGGLSDEEIDRLGRALIDIDSAIEELIQEQGIGESVRSVRDGLDNLVGDLVDQIIGPETCKN